MVIKNIAITEEAYSLLLRHKRPHESFSEVIKGHFKKKKHLADYAGIWANIHERRWKNFEKNIEAAKKGMHRGF